ncbi:putative quinol monooxygenase [Roseibium album]|uniref:putative quinol monooxygenase n=1 Tax=Roseibium album TaxID=311410 RepID=UPI002492EC30|nr:putative quinol monooxygenase [Roseibium album]
MFAVTVQFQIRDGMFETFMPLMIENAKASLEGEPGCRQFDVCSDPDRPNEVFLYEIYDDAAAFQAHLKTPHFQAFDVQVAPMISEKSVATYAKVRS